jgi:polyvinyl alcohol dehydrogenase (cytochrome)
MVSVSQAAASGIGRHRLSAVAMLGAALCFGASACSSSEPGGMGAAGGALGTVTGPAPGEPAASAGTGAVVPSAGTTGAAGDAAAVAGTGASGTGTITGPVAGTGAPAAGTGGDMGVPGASADWTLMGYDVASTYFNRAETVLTKENAASLTEIWSADMGGNTYSAALQVGDRIYAAGPSSVRAFMAASGDELWRASVSSSASIAYDDGTIYAHTSSSQIVALNAADGSQRWSAPVDAQRGDGTSSPIVAGNVVIVGGSNGGIELSSGSFRGYVVALDKMTGRNAWSTYTVPTSANGAAIWSSVSADLAAGRVYASTGNNYGPPATDTSDAIIALDLGTGEVIWKNQRVQNDTFRPRGGSGPDFDFGANPVLYEAMVDGVMTKLVSAGAKSGAAHAIKRDDGMLQWTRSLGGGTADGSRGIFTNSTWTGKYMLFACNEGAGRATLYALDGATGDVAWMRAVPGQVWGRISVANGVGFVGAGTTLEAFDVDTGAVLKSVRSKGGTIASTITIANGRVAFGEGLSWSGGLRGSRLTVLAVP